MSLWARVRESLRIDRCRMTAWLVMMISAVFCSMNAEKVTLSLGPWSVIMPLAWCILGAMAFGLILGRLSFLWRKRARSSLWHLGDVVVLLCLIILFPWVINGIWHLMQALQDRMLFRKTCRQISPLVRIFQRNGCTSIEKDIKQWNKPNVVYRRFLVGEGFMVHLKQNVWVAFRLKKEPALSVYRDPVSIKEAAIPFYWDCQIIDPDRQAPYIVPSGTCRDSF